MASTKFNAALDDFLGMISVSKNVDARKEGNNDEEREHLIQSLECLQRQGYPVYYSRNSPTHVLRQRLDFAICEPMRAIINKACDLGCTTPRDILGKKSMEELKLIVADLETKEKQDALQSLRMMRKNGVRCEYSSDMSVDELNKIIGSTMHKATEDTQIQRAIDFGCTLPRTQLEQMSKPELNMLVNRLTFRMIAGAFCNFLEDAVFTKHSTKQEPNQKQDQKSS